jgi:membrane-associated phospholipid phosphatase
VFVNPAAVGDWLAATAIASVNPWALTGATALATSLAARRGGFQTGIAVVVMVAGANISTYVLEHGLGALDPLGGERHRVLGEGFFPSGHATAAMSLTCALIAAVPSAYTQLAAVVGGAYAAIVGLALVAPANHHLSDVLAGIYITAGWAGLAQAARPNGPALVRALPSVRLSLAAAVIAAVGGVVTSLVAGLSPQAHPEFVLASAAIIWSSFVVAGVEASRVSPREPTARGAAGARRRARSA